MTDDTAPIERDDHRIFHAKAVTDADTGVDTDADAESAAPASAPDESDPAPVPIPRTRWAGIVWGLILGALSAMGVWLTTTVDRFDAFTASMWEVPAPTAIGYAVLIAGALLLVAGLVSLLRRAQRARAERDTRR